MVARVLAKTNFYCVKISMSLTSCRHSDNFEHLSQAYILHNVLWTFKMCFWPYLCYSLSWFWDRGTSNMTGLFCVHVVKSVSILATSLTYFPSNFFFFFCCASNLLISLPSLLLMLWGFQMCLKEGCSYTACCSQFSTVTWTVLFICRGTAVKQMPILQPG